MRKKLHHKLRVRLARLGESPFQPLLVDSCRSFSRVVGIATLGCCIALALQAEGHPNRLEDADEFVGKVASAYAKCTSYEDTGTIETKYRGLGNETSKCDFETFFVRENRFRFSFSDPEDEFRITLVKNGDSSFYSPSYSKRRLTGEDIPSMISRAAGITKRASTIVPNLLLPNQQTSSFLDALDNVRVSEETDIEGIAGFLVSGRKADRDIDVLVDRTSLLIRKITVHFDSNRTVSERVYRFTPTVNSEIDDSKFRVNHSVQGIE